MRFPFYKQLDQMDCGPTCLRMIAKFYGKSYSLQTIREHTKISKVGVSLYGISEAAENLGFKTMSVRVSFEKLVSGAPVPFIIHWGQDHFVVVTKISKHKIWIANPSAGIITYSYAEFCQKWISTVTAGRGEGIALLMEPTMSFYESEDEKHERVGFGLVTKYFSIYKKLIAQLVLGLIVGSLLQSILPFLTQAIVDVGINTRNINFVYMILAAQLTLMAGRFSFDFLRSWILLHISSRVNINILSTFLIKLMRLPIAYFDAKHFGDIMQRMSDHQRIQSFLTHTSLQTIFSVFNILIFGLVLAWYYTPIFLVFALCTFLYIMWITIFLNRRRILDFKRFDANSKNNSALLQLVYGMQEIKLSNSETHKRWEWERVQAQLFNLNIKGEKLSQYQQFGAFLINETKNIIIVFLGATAVINGEMTLGSMLSIQFIIGQLNSPVEQLTVFLQSYQDARISLERLDEIHKMKDEELAGLSTSDLVPEGKGIKLSNVSFSYSDDINDSVLKNINLHIPTGKITAIVGMSGSGKTTLLKLLLKFYEPSAGELHIGEANMKNLSHKIWRSYCGVVTQESFIFSDSIAKNIALGDERPDPAKLQIAVKIANIEEFIESLPSGYNSKIGNEGIGLSQGQKQRILIARAVYKNPPFVFLDEATNSLDANNESIIMENLANFFKGRTVVVVAHRLSTVKDADQIIVLDKGRIIEAGTHAELTHDRKEYYQLVRKQLQVEN